MKKTLKKILEELNQPTPRLDYIKGMLEVLIGEEESTSALSAQTWNTGPISTTNFPVSSGIAIVTSSNAPMDEGSLLDASVRANIESIKKISEQSTQ